MILCGVIMKKYHSDEPNGAVGYRTKRAMKNNDTWKFANELAGSIWIKWGTVVTVISVIFEIIYFCTDEKYGATFMLSAVTIQSLIILLSFYPVEKALKENFDDEGIKK